MKVTNREADQWTRVAHQASMRKAVQARQEAVAAYVRQHQESKPKRRDRCSGITVRPVGLPAVQADLFGVP